MNLLLHDIHNLALKEFLEVPRYVSFPLILSNSIPGIAYYMTKNKLGYDHSFNFVKSKRPCIFPNSGFVQQLRDLEKQMGL